jgi:hypothetical protein
LVNEGGHFDQRHPKTESGWIFGGCRCFDRGRVRFNQ